MQEGGKFLAIHSVDPSLGKIEHSELTFQPIK
jgi:hypothetical protein